MIISNLSVSTIIIIILINNSIEHTSQPCLKRRFIQSFNPKKFPTKSRQKYKNITSMSQLQTAPLICVTIIHLSLSCLSRMIDLLQIEPKVERNSTSHQKTSPNTLCSKITATLLKYRNFSRWTTINLPISYQILYFFPIQPPTSYISTND